MSRGDIGGSGLLKNCVRTIRLFARFRVYREEKSTLFQAFFIRFSCVLRNSHSDKNADRAVRHRAGECSEQRSGNVWLLRSAKDANSSASTMTMLAVKSAWCSEEIIFPPKVGEC